MKKLNDFLPILCLFITWKSLLYITSVLAVVLIPLSSTSFLGGGYKMYFENPLLFGWSNFDGEHYLSISQNGYSSLNHSFFPVYPFTLKLLSISEDSLQIFVATGILVSNTSFLVALYILYKLINLDFTKRIALVSILCIILFPTSFYFNAVYTESLFLLLVVSSFFAARLGKLWLAGFLGMLASATRVVGILLLPALLVEYWIQNKVNLKNMIPLTLIPLGLAGYMTYLYLNTGNPTAFYNELSQFGVQRQGYFILLPQVFYRYINMLTHLNLFNNIYLVVLAEFLVAVSGILLLVWGFVKKIRPAYLMFAIFSFILPTLTGSFSSLPRYVLVIFPIFIILGILLSNKKLALAIILFLFAFFLITGSALFFRGYWIA